MFTWSLGWTPPFSMYAASLLLPMGSPFAMQMRLAITSLAFMFVLVPLPVWKMSTGKFRASPPCSVSPLSI